MNSNARTVASIIVSMLEAAGVDRAFSVSGESYLPLLDELEARGNIDVVTCRHEGGAGLMAVADAKLTGKLAVCMVSRGPGAANAALGVLAAREDTVPFLLLVGQVEKAHLRRDAFQEVDYSRFFQGTAKWSAEINDPERVADILSRAIQVAYGGTPGPVVVALPEDVLHHLVTVTAPDVRLPVRTGPDEEALQQVERLLAAARKPLLIAGGELANPEGRAALKEAAERWGVPVLVSFRRLDLFPNGHPLFAGELGFFNKPEHIAAYQESDLIVAVGTRLGDLTTQGYQFPDSPQPRQPLVHVHRDPEVLGRNFVPTVGIHCDTRRFLLALGRLPSATATPERKAWSERLRGYRKEITHWDRKTAEDGVVFGNVVQSLGRHITEDAIVVLDAGVSAAMLYRHYEFTPPQILLTPITGSMGFGIPAATAAALRYPGRQVICVIGDGGMLMGGNELAVAAERNLPLVILLANNHSYAAIRVNLERAYPGRKTATELFNPDFGKLGEAYGCRTLRIESEEQVEPVLAEAFSENGLTFVEVRTSLSAVLPVVQGAAPAQR